MLKKRFTSLIVGLALLAAVVGAAANVANSLSPDTPVQAIACHTTGSSGGGC